MSRDELGRRTFKLETGRKTEERRRTNTKTWEQKEACFFLERVVRNPWNQILERNTR
jgi:hypothetical protein